MTKHFICRNPFILQSEGGKCKSRSLVNEKGIVVKAKAVSGNALLHKSAE